MTPLPLVPLIPPLPLLPPPDEPWPALDDPAPLPLPAEPSAETVTTDPPLHEGPAARRATTRRADERADPARRSNMPVSVLV